MKVPKWKTKDGKLIEIHEMSDKHLLNSQRYCRNQVCGFNDMIKTAAHPVFASRGDGACYAYEQAVEEGFKVASSCNYIEHFLDREVKKRGLISLEINPPLNLPEIENVEYLDEVQYLNSNQRKEKKL